MGGHEDFSLYESLKQLNNVQPVPDGFELTLKHNSSCHYCRTYIFENCKCLYERELMLHYDCILGAIKSNDKDISAFDKFKNDAEDNMQLYYEIPLRKISSEYKTKDIRILSTKIADVIKNM